MQRRHWIRVLLSRIDYGPIDASGIHSQDNCNLAGLRFFDVNVSAQCVLRTQLNGLHIKPLHRHRSCLCR